MNGNELITAMKIHYIGHSGFAIECCNGILIVVDYFNDSEGIMPEILSRASKAYILVSHSHPDHFNKHIFHWNSTFPADFTYIVSGELWRKLSHSRHEAITDVPIHSLRRGECYTDEKITIHAFGSTDIGVSYLMEIFGRRIFHAGDLNNWHWSEESTPQEIKTAEGNYLAILRKIKEQFPAIDIAMFPVDPRIGGDFALGARQFMSAIKVADFIPMHQWGDFSRSCNFSLYSAPGVNCHCMHNGDYLIL